MRILVHDYCGHPFQIQLSRELAKRGHEVLHLYSSSIASPRGPMAPRDDDPETFTVEPISIGQQVDKYKFVRRFGQELGYGVRLCRRIRAFRPDVSLVGNTPIDIMMMIEGLHTAMNKPWVFWLQDVHSVAIGRYVGEKIPVFGPGIAASYRVREGLLMRRCMAIVAISDGFRPTIERIAGAKHAPIYVIENWAPLEDMPQRPRKNEWARTHGIEKTLNFIYSGTLGLKHDPSLLVELAGRFREDPQVRVIVCSEGPGAEYLRAEKTKRSLDNLLVFPWQAFEDLPFVLASADILVVLLEPEAGELSVPSKVLSNMCAGRAQLIHVPPSNLASRIVRRERAGLCSDPNSRASFFENARELQSDAEERAALGRAGRGYAERAFDIERIATRFENVVVGS